MGRGLGRLQQDILTCLSEAAPADLPMRPTQIIDRLGRERTAANRTTVSKALRGLAERDLIQVWAAACYLQGKGYRYGPKSDA